jgi:hypothetical protein
MSLSLKNFYGDVHAPFTKFAKSILTLLQNPMPKRVEQGKQMSRIKRESKENTSQNVNNAILSG